MVNMNNECNHFYDLCFFWNDFLVIVCVWLVLRGWRCGSVCGGATEDNGWAAGCVQSYRFPLLHSPSGTGQWERLYQLSWNSLRMFLRYCVHNSEWTDDLNKSNWSTKCPSSSTGSGPSQFSCGVSHGTLRAAEQLLQSSRGSLHPEWWQQQPFHTAGAGADIPTWGSKVPNTDPAAADSLS